MKDVSDKISRENQITHFMLNSFFSFFLSSENRAGNEIVWKNIF
jgi:hypothetical protein